MIDFRYHIVSLVAVFLALATGIVIGGFTLKGSVGDTLQNQVTQLRTERDATRGQLDDANASLKKRDEYVTDTTTKVISGSLKGRSIAIVTLPGTNSQLVQSTQKTVTAAGGSVASTTQLTYAWVNGKVQEATFDRMATRLLIQTQDTSQNRVPGTVLGRVLLGGTGETMNAMDELVRDKLIEQPSSDAKPAEGVVVLWPGQQTGDPQADIAGWTNLIAAIGTSLAPVVGMSSGPAAQNPPKSDALVASIRETPDAAARMSTVDDGDLGIGQIAFALAMRNEFVGTSGQFGVAGGATAVIPPLAVPQ